MKSVFCLFVFFVSLTSSAQVNPLDFSEKTEKMYTPYMVWRHQGMEGLASFKKNEPHNYLLELWYYSSSFYILRDYSDRGEKLDESIIDIGRFENQRKDTEETILVLPGFKDAIVLLPSSKLLFKP